MTQRDYVRTRREDVRAIPAGAEKLIKRMTKAFMRINVAVYKKSGGRFMGSFLGRPICIVTMTGRKTGKRYEIPLMYVPYGEQRILVASMGGASPATAVTAPLALGCESAGRVAGRERRASRTLAAPRQASKHREPEGRAWVAGPK